uniref:Uncharacterized protein n=1 Tax=Lepeophtheirus salmonis TaxID=72036 RepID=A0A0K2T6L9_LEPSM
MLTQAATTSRRTQQFNHLRQHLEFGLLMEESVLSREELGDKLTKKILPSDFILVTKLRVAFLKLSHDEKLGPN